MRSSRSNTKLESISMSCMYLENRLFCLNVHKNTMVMIRSYGANRQSQMLCKASVTV